MKAPRFTYCRMCGASWITVLQIPWHKPGCLLKPAHGRTITEAPRWRVPS